MRPVLFRLDPETAHNLAMNCMVVLSWAIGGIVRAGRIAGRGLTWALALSWVLSRLLW